ncbi:hypothetical protein [Streptomyces sp. NPDC002573]|uniref:MmyB family transcriptional regulator n=1 Tax=Streptomyces sp. NPDC002573 TaxID=3364651 RepID=UPI0036AE0E0D
MALSRGGSRRLAYGPRPARPKTFHHPEVGDLTLGHQSMELEGTPDHRLVVHPAEPDTPEYDARVPSTYSAPSRHRRDGHGPNPPPDPTR